MSAEQTYTSRDNQENTTSKNALCINDCSSHGLSLQRKANVAQCNSNVVQRDAWVAIKPLDALYSSSATSTSAPGEREPDAPLTEDANSIAQGEDPARKGQRLDYNKDDLQPHHRHIIFGPKEENEYYRKKVTGFTPEEKYVQKEICRMRNKSESDVDNNIGYGCDHPYPYIGLGGATIKGEGILFSENVFHRGYTIMQRISRSFDEDKRLLNSIKKYRPYRFFEGGKLWYRNYDLVLSNCQDWVEDVKKDAGLG